MLRTVAPLLLVIGVGLAGCSAPRAAEIAPGMVGVQMSDGRFLPAAMTIQRFDTVRFTNLGTTDHTVTVRLTTAVSGDYLHDTLVQVGAVQDVTFATAGTYHVWCRYHGSEGQGMHMTIEVAG